MGFTGHRKLAPQDSSVYVWGYLSVCVCVCESNCNVDPGEQTAAGVYMSIFRPGVLVGIRHDYCVCVCAWIYWVYVCAV